MVQPRWSEAPPTGSAEEKSVDVSGFRVSLVIVFMLFLSRCLVKPWVWPRPLSSDRCGLLFMGVKQLIRSDQIRLYHPTEQQRRR